MDLKQQLKTEAENTLGVTIEEPELSMLAEQAQIYLDNAVKVWNDTIKEQKKFLDKWNIEDECFERDIRKGFHVSFAIRAFLEGCFKTSKNLEVKDTKEYVPNRELLKKAESVMRFKRGSSEAAEADYKKWRTELSEALRHWTYPSSEYDNCVRDLVICALDVRIADRWGEE